MTEPQTQKEQRDFLTERAIRILRLLRRGIGIYKPVTFQGYTGFESRNVEEHPFGISVGALKRLYIL